MHLKRVHAIMDKFVLLPLEDGNGYFISYEDIRNEELNVGDSYHHQRRAVLFRHNGQQLRHVRQNLKNQSLTVRVNSQSRKTLGLLKFENS